MKIGSKGGEGSNVNLLQQDDSLDELHIHGVELFRVERLGYVFV